VLKERGLQMILFFFFFSNCCRERVAKRHMKAWGFTREQAVERCNFNDRPNAEFVIQHRYSLLLPVDSAMSVRSWLKVCSIKDHVIQSLEDTDLLNTERTK
jgi:hypothetical protein